MAARSALRIAATDRAGCRGHPGLRGGLRGGPVRRIGPQGEDQDVELLQLVLLLHGRVDAPCSDGGGVHPGQRRVGFGSRHPDHRHGDIGGVLRRRLQDVPALGALRQPVYSPCAGGGCRREEEEAAHGL